MKIILDFCFKLAYLINRESNDFAGGNDNAEWNGNRKRKREGSDGNPTGALQLGRDVDHDGSSCGQYFDELILNPLHGKKGIIGRFGPSVVGPGISQSES